MPPSAKKEASSAAAGGVGGDNGANSHNIGGKDSAEYVIDKGRRSSIDLSRMSENSHDAESSTFPPRASESSFALCFFLSSILLSVDPPGVRPNKGTSIV